MKPKRPIFRVGQVVAVKEFYRMGLCEDARLYGKILEIQERVERGDYQYNISPSRKHYDFWAEGCLRPLTASETRKRDDK